jgi:hypothetical protein
MYSKEDEYFRVATCSLINANPTGKKIWAEKVLASTLKERRNFILFLGSTAT